MKKIRRNVHIGIYGLAVLSFFLPFIVVSCPGGYETNLTGIQLAFGIDIKEPQIGNETPQTHYVQEPLIQFVLLCLIIGIASIFMNKVLSVLLNTISSIAGLVLLLLFKYKIDKEALSLATDLIQLKYSLGYWLITCFFVLSVIALLIFTVFEKNEKEPNVQK